MIKKIREYLDKVHMGIRLAHYPPCDHLNTAIGLLLIKPDENESAIEEICYAILKSGGYYYPHIAEKLESCGFGDFVTEKSVMLND